MAIGKKVKGITIEFDGDTTKLGRALSDISNKTTGLDRELKNVDRAMKFNPGNTELVAQKQQLLTQKVQQTKEKLDALKAAQKSLDDDSSVDKTSQEYMELRREIIETESKLGKFEEELRGIGNVKLTALGQQFEAAGKKMSAAGDQMTQKVTAPLVGIGTVAAKIGLDFDSQMSKVAAIAGATGGDFDKLRDKAREMGKATKFTATESGEAFEYMAMAGWKTGDMLTGIEPILQLATAAGTDLGTTSDIVTDALTAFGLKAKDAGHFSDVLAAASSNANTNVEMMGESFKYAAPIAGAMGYNVEDVSTALGLMANAGIKASTAGTTLRTLMTNMANPTEKMAGAMETLGVSLTDDEGNMKSFKQIMDDLREGFGNLKIPMEEFQQQAALLDSALADGSITEAQYQKAMEELTGQAYGAEGALKAQAAAQLAGKTGMSGLMAIVNASEQDYNNLAGAIANCDGKTQEMSDTMMANTKGGITVMISALQNAAIAISDVLSPWITAAAKKVEELANKFSELSPTTQKVIVVIAGIVAAAGPLLSIVGRLLMGVNGIITAGPKILTAAKTFFGVFGKIPGLISKVISVFRILSSVLMANPWIAVAAAVLAAVILIVKHWDWVKAKAKAIWTAIKNAVINPIKNMVEGIKKYFGIMQNAIATRVYKIKSKVTEIFGNIRDAMLAPIKSAIQKIKVMIKKIKDFFNFKVSLPKIKLPHFSIEPQGWSIGDLLDGVIPHLGIKWYAKGGIFNSPSVIGVGEAGPEAVLPIDRLQDMIAASNAQMVSAMVTALQAANMGAGPGGETKIVIQLGGATVATEIFKLNKQGQLIMGES